MEKVEQAVARGVNVVIWFAVDLMQDAAGRPQIGHDDAQVKVTNFTCIAETARALQAQNLPTTHLISIGGWAAPRPDTSFNGEQWFAAWSQWNQQIARPDLGWSGFDGIDWDLEGNTNKSSAENVLSPACVELVGTMSQAAKRAGFIVSMVPPESYLDPTTSDFDLSLLHTYPGGEFPEFGYHGQNSYAIWLAKFGNTSISVANTSTAVVVDTFDIVDVQLYENCAHCAYHVNVLGEDPVAYLAGYIKLLIDGWLVKFSQSPAVGFPDAVVQIKPSQLVLGFARGWSEGKSVFITPEDIGKAYERMPSGQRPRGAMYWCINEGDKPANGTNATIDFASGFNAFLNVRSKPATGHQ